jgi:hypothetical protein
MEDILKQVADQIKDSNERWAKIEELAKALEYINKQGVSTSSEGATSVMCKLLLLLVEQLRPMSTAGEHASKLQGEIMNMLDSIGNSFGGGKK